jgi:hypothetical protein
LGWGTGWWGWGWGWPAYWDGSYYAGDYAATSPYYVDAQSDSNYVQDQSWRDYDQAPRAGDQAGYAGQGDGVPQNDHFVGTGEELSALSRGLQVPPGQHTITVSRQGMTTEEFTVVVGPGKSETVNVSLRPS